MDKWRPEVRSKMMARVKNTNTRPEIVVRKVLHGLGYRYRLHNRLLAGSPDIVLPRHRKIIFAHGCFWHGHSCSRGKRPTTRVDFWNKKLDANQARDNATYQSLINDGWKVLIIWECHTKDDTILQQRIEEFMSLNYGQKETSSI